MAMDKSKLIFAARVTQVACSTLQVAFATTLLFWMHHWYYDYYPLWALVPLVAVGCLVDLIGLIGIFAHRRPQDVHWHLVLMLDWFALWLAVGSAILAIVSSYQMWSEGASFVIMMDFSAIACTPSVLIPLIHTHRLKKRSLLPLAGSKQSWYYLNEQHEPPQDFRAHMRFSTLPRQVVLGPASQPDTHARWSGVSDVETNTILDARSEDAVPPYSGPMSPPLSMIKDRSFA